MKILNCCLFGYFLVILSSEVLTAGIGRNIAINSEWFPLNIIHLNDMHARFEETSVDSGICKEGQKCVGGYARVVTTVKKLQNENQHLNPIYLNAGDNFQGTLWYNIFKWNVTSYFLNLLPADVLTIGNHEFDHGIEGVVPFMENSKSPIVITNVDDSEEPLFQNKYTNSTVIERNGRKIGIVGVILATTNKIANTRNLKFTPEPEAVREEALKLKNQGVNIIVVLSHCGLDVDRIIAKNGGPDIDIIVGGHSHTFLFSGPNPPGTDRPQDSYPVVEKQPDGREVLIVQASAYTKYLGNITLFFDYLGNIKSFEGAPIYLDSDVVPDPDIVKELQPWKEMVDKEGKREIGESKIDLLRTGCYNYECAMGSFIADAYADAYTPNSDNPDKAWTYATIALVNAGGVRASLSHGKITYADLITTTPFSNTLDSLELLGKHIREALEFSVRGTLPNLLQVSGLKVKFNISNPVNERVVELKVLCRLCDVPKYESLNDDEYYRVVVPSFLSGGGDHYDMIADNKRNDKVGILDIDALTNYIEKNSPIVLTGPKKRITILK